jgi:hypothetical protein
VPEVSGFLLDDDNEEKIAAHGISLAQVSQTLDNDHVLVRNRKNRRGLYLFIGRDHGGACLAIPIEETHEPGLWRPITAWPCKPVELQRLRRRER